MLPNINEIMCQYKLVNNVHSSFICNQLKLEITENVPLTGNIDTNVVYLYNGTLMHNKRNEPLTYTTCMDSQIIMLNERSQVHILPFHLYLTI